MTVGETLSRARRKRGLSVEDVAADTCIRATLIHAIEADHYELCGGTVYARGHIRSIARVVGIDADTLIGEFDTVHQVEKVVAAVAATPTDQAIVARSEPRQPNWTLAMASALVLICGFALFGLLHNNSGTPKTRQGGKAPQVQIQPKTSRSSPPPAVAAVPASRATMLVRTLNGRTWLSVTTKSGQTLFNNILEPGQRKFFSDRRGLAYVIGNAPAVDVIVNGNDIGQPPSLNVVARGSVVPGKGSVREA